MHKKTAFPQPWLSTAAVSSFPNSPAIFGRLLFNGKDKLVLPVECTEVQKKRLLVNPQGLVSFESEQGLVWIVSPFLEATEKSALKPDPRLEVSSFAKVRDAAGLALQAIEKSGVRNLEVALPDNGDDLAAFLTGLEIAKYRFKSPKADADDQPLKLKLMQKKQALNGAALSKAELLGWCTNVARHLVNLPPNELTPMTFAQIATSLTADLANVKTEVWDKERLKKEKMNLVLAVGSASVNPPCLVHLSYRPNKKAKSIALVGKGITFDSGGLDIKTAAGMRLMKKDMGGGAAVLGAFLWAASRKLTVAVDAYISLAENSIGSAAFRPSDVYTSRSGQTVEITNTDAEGRLVLADALDVAVEGDPAVIIDLATLTGAIKVGLGTGIAGLFSNHAPLASDLATQFQRGGDPVWSMPLFQKYRSPMASTFADMVNSVEVPFGGAITAALFLENFVKSKPWAHFDIYAWKDGPEGAWGEGGGSGQGVQGLAHWLESQSGSQQNTNKK